MNIGFNFLAVYSAEKGFTFLEEGTISKGWSVNL